MDPPSIIEKHCRESALVKQQLYRHSGSAIAEAAKRAADLLARGGKLLLCGNGGSAADSQHLAAEFTSRLRASVERPPIPAIALTTDTSFLTARSNDYGFDEVFERLVDALGRRGDVLITISTSGNSRNLIRAVTRSRQAGIYTIGFLGSDGGFLRALVDCAILVPSDNTQYIQESHIAIGHIFCELVEDALFGSTGSESISPVALAERYP
jgi:D-sedoheptulose 7-phosphate isomerase